LASGCALSRIPMWISLIISNCKVDKPLIKILKDEDFQRLLAASEAG
jgi:hypothetical protein